MWVCVSEQGLNGDLPQPWVFFWSCGSSYWGFTKYCLVAMLGYEATCRKPRKMFEVS